MRVIPNWGSHPEVVAGVASGEIGTASVFPARSTGTNAWPPPRGRCSSSVTSRTRRALAIRQQNATVDVVGLLPAPLRASLVRLGRAVGLEAHELGELQKLDAAPDLGEPGASEPVTLNRKARRLAERLESAPPAPKVRQPARSKETPTERRARREREHVERFRAKNLKRFAAAPEDVPVHRRDTYRRVQACQADASGRTLQWWLDQCPHKIFVARVVEAALVPERGGTHRYSFRGDTPGPRRARAVACIAMLVYEHTRETRNGHVCRGLSLKYMQACLADPYTGLRPARTTINGRHRRDGSVHTGEVGWLRALVECGAFKRKQYKDPAVVSRVAQPWELSRPVKVNGTDRVFMMNWYTLPMRQDEAMKLTAAELAYYLEEFEQACLVDVYAPVQTRRQRTQAAEQRAHAPP